MNTHGLVVTPSNGRITQSIQTPTKMTEGHKVSIGSRACDQKSFMVRSMVSTICGSQAHELFCTVHQLCTAGAWRQRRDADTTPKHTLTESDIHIATFLVR